MNLDLVIQCLVLSSFEQLQVATIEFHTFKTIFFIDIASTKRCCALWELSVKLGHTETLSFVHADSAIQPMAGYIRLFMLNGVAVVSKSKSFNYLIHVLEALLVWTSDCGAL